MSERTYSELRLMLEGMTESEGFVLFNAMQNKFGWVGTVFCNADIESAWQEQTDSTLDVPEGVLYAVHSTYAWRHLPDRMCEVGNDILWSTVAEVITEYEDEAS